jgi:hypothetical protein
MHWFSSGQEASPGNRAAEKILCQDKLEYRAYLYAERIAQYADYGNFAYYLILSNCFYYS